MDAGRISARDLSTGNCRHNARIALLWPSAHEAEDDESLEEEFEANVT
jgi:hypothetical protein